MLEHKYIRQHTTQEDFDTAVENREYEEVGAVAITDNRNTTPDEYQYSQRTTNDDNLYMAEYNANDPIDYFLALEIVWGYFGWQWVDIEIDDVIYAGGQYYEKVKIETYLEISDGYRLYHIDYLDYNTPSVREIEYFNAENIVSAKYAFTNVTKINTNNFPALKRVTNMFNMKNFSYCVDPNKYPSITRPFLPDNVLNAPLVTDAQQMFTGDSFDGIPRLKLGQLTNVKQMFYSVDNSSYPYHISDDGESDIIYLNDVITDLSLIYDYTNFISHSFNGYLYFKPPYNGEETMKFYNSFPINYSVYFNIDIIKPWTDGVVFGTVNSSTSYLRIHSNVGNGLKESVFLGWYNRNTNSIRTIYTNELIISDATFNNLVSVDTLFYAINFSSNAFNSIISKVSKHDNRIRQMFYFCYLNCDFTFDCYDDTHPTPYSDNIQVCNDLCYIRSTSYEITLINADKPDVLMFTGTRCKTIKGTFRDYDSGEYDPYLSFYWIYGNVTNWQSGIQIYTHYINLYGWMGDFANSDLEIVIDGRLGSSMNNNLSSLSIVCDFRNIGTSMTVTPIVKSVNWEADLTGGCYDTQEDGMKRWVAFSHDEWYVGNPSSIVNVRFGNFNMYGALEFARNYTNCGCPYINLDNATNLVYFDFGAVYCSFNLGYCKNLDITTLSNTLLRQRTKPSNIASTSTNKIRQLRIHRTIYDQLSSDVIAHCKDVFHLIDVVEDEI